MKLFPLLLSAMCASLTCPLSAAESFRVESVLYVFRAADFPQVHLNTAAVAATGHGESFTAPARLSFNQHTLELSGGTYRWNDGAEAAPAQFSPVGVPAMVVSAAQKASVYCALPVQYMEPAPGGGLQVKQLDRTAPDVPHYELTLEVRPAESADRLAVACELQLAVMAGREKIPGVDLDVGRPLLARLQENFKFESRKGEWSGIVLRQPGGGDYGLLLLLKVGGASASAINAAAPRLGTKPMTPAQLDEFATHYYLHPRPELIAAAIEALGSSRFLEPGVGSPVGPRLNGYFWTFVGFFAEVFAANPERVDEWQKLGRKQEWQTRDCLQAALKYRRPGALLAVEGPWVLRPGAILSLGNSWGSANEARWGAFFASGNAAYLRKVVAQLREIDPRDPTVESLAPLWSLARQMPEHPLVRTTLEAARADADPRSRALIDDLLTKDTEAIRQEIADLRPSSSLQDDYVRSPKTDGARSAGDYGQVIPGQDVVGSRLPPDQMPKK